MARIRTVKPEFWGHPKVAQISRDARLLFIGLLNLADDDGRLLGSPKTISGAVFPHDDDATAKRVEKWMDELEDVELIIRYEVNGIAYVLLPGFTEHQKISHPTPSRLPEPLPQDSGMFPEFLGPDLGTGSKEQGTGRRVRATRIPDEFTVTDEMQAWVQRDCPAVNWRSETESFVDWAKSCGTQKAIKSDWVRAWRNWMRREQKTSSSSRQPARTFLGRAS